MIYRVTVYRGLRKIEIRLTSNWQMFNTSVYARARVCVRVCACMCVCVRVIVTIHIKGSGS